MDIVPITIWREARSEGPAGMRAVLHVIFNRAAHNSEWPSDPERVCLQRYQFSCWNTDDRQRDYYPSPTDTSYVDALALVADPGTDPTGGATAYFDSSIFAPIWATPASFVCEIGRLRFYRV